MKTAVRRLTRVRCGRDAFPPAARALAAWALLAFGLVACSRETFTGVNLVLEVGGRVTQVRIDSVIVGDRNVPLTDADRVFPQAEGRDLRSGDEFTLRFADADAGKMVYVTAQGLVAGNPTTDVVMTELTTLRMRSVVSLRLSLGSSDGGQPGSGGSGAGTGGASDGGGSGGATGKGGGSGETGGAPASSGGTNGSSGGTAGSGGVIGTGGIFGTGGARTGGMPGTGGVATGGAGTGGVGTGGAGTGGAGTGGAGTGGACMNACTNVGTQCAGASVQTCAVAGNGCPAFSSSMCATGNVCERYMSPACVDPNWAEWPVPPSTGPTGYTNNNDATVTDNTTGLMWQLPPAPAAMTQTDAVTYCSTTLATQALGGHNDWRLPTKIELLSIVDYGKSDPSINPLFTSTVSNYYWSSTLVAGNSSDAWAVNFTDGLTGEVVMTFSSYYVRCVR